MVENKNSIFTEWASRWRLWHGAVEPPAGQSVAYADHWAYPEELHPAKPLGSLATPKVETEGW